MRSNGKKNALLEDRFAQIETENRLLLEKMSRIVRVSLERQFWYLNSVFFDLLKR